MMMIHAERHSRTERCLLESNCPFVGNDFVVIHTHTTLVALVRAGSFRVRTQLLPVGMMFCCVVAAAALIISIRHCIRFLNGKRRTWDALNILKCWLLTRYSPRMNNNMGLLKPFHSPNINQPNSKHPSTMEYGPHSMDFFLFCVCVGPVGAMLLLIFETHNTRKKGEDKPAAKLDLHAHQGK